MKNNKFIFLILSLLFLSCQKKKENLSFNQNSPSSTNCSPYLQLAQIELWNHEKRSVDKINIKDVTT
ncbi:MAG: hypothetical protein D6785_16200, partial [Planctomycetota bacterium]